MTNLRTDAEGRYTDDSGAILDMAQFEKLRALNPPISAAEIAHRMAWSRLDTRRMLRKVGDNRK